MNDFFADIPGPRVPVVTHNDSCKRRPCRCFQIRVEVTEVHESILTMRLLWRDEVVGTCRLLLLGGDALIMSSAATYRASDTTDWAYHHQVVTEVMVREAALLADQQGRALGTSRDVPQTLLDELGFVPAGALMRRPAAPS